MVKSERRAEQNQAAQGTHPNSPEPLLLGKAVRVVNLLLGSRTPVTQLLRLLLLQLLLWGMREC